MRMRVLVYGSGVIGSYLAHMLCTAGNDVTMRTGFLSAGNTRRECCRYEFWFEVYQFSV